MADNSTYQKIDVLTGIRGFAVLLVLLSHASNEGLSLLPILSFSGAGRYGVFLFFVLSSYLLTKQFIYIFVNKKNINTALKHYFIRRFIRIYPLLTLALVVYFLLRKYGMNIYNINFNTLWKTLLLLDAHGIFWTIPVEFQYYFILPLVSFIFIYFNNILINAIVLLGFVIIWLNFNPPVYKPSLQPFLPIFLIGSFTAVVSYHIDKNSTLISNPTFKNLMQIASFLIFILFLLLIPNYYNLVFKSDFTYTHFHKRFILFAILSSGLIISVIYGSGLIHKLMSAKIMIFLGNISFSAYLFHIIILKWLIKYQVTGSSGLIIFMVGVLFISAILYHYFERPLSKIYVLKDLTLKKVNN